MNFHDIAREAGVSIATVSRVVNKSPLVSEKTREKVQEVIDKHHYTPNALARGLIRNATKTIGVLTVDIRSIYYSTVIHSVERILTSLGYNIFLCNTGGEVEEKIHYIRVLLEKKVDGLIFVGSVYNEIKGNEHIRNVSRKIPVVLLNNQIVEENIYCLLCDDEDGTFKATRFLLEQGRKRFIYIHNTNTYSGKNKKKGFEKAIQTWDKPNIECHMMDQIQESRPLEKQLHQIYSKGRFDAMITSDDLHANKAIQFLHKKAIKIPQEIGIFGYNNSSICEYTYPNLSSVDSRMNDLGMEGARLMDQILQGNPPVQNIRFLTPEIIIRSST